MTTIPPTAGKRHFIVRTAVMATGLALCAAGVSAQTAAWPTKALRIVVGYPAGSSPDIQARLLTEPLSKALGQAEGGGHGAQQVLAAAGVVGWVHGVSPGLNVWNSVV